MPFVPRVEFLNEPENIYSKSVGDVRSSLRICFDDTGAIMFFKIITIVFMGCLLFSSPSFADEVLPYNSEMHEQSTAFLCTITACRHLQIPKRGDEGFRRTACYAHLIGSMLTAGMKLDVMGELGADEPCLERFSRALGKWCRLQEISGVSTFINSLRHIHARLNGQMRIYQIKKIISM